MGRVLFSEAAILGSAHRKVLAIFEKKVMSILDTLIQRARRSKKRIVLCEGNDVRVVSAAAKAAKDGIADVQLVGSPNDIQALAAANGIDLDGVQLIDPTRSVLRQTLADELLALRQNKGMTAQQAQQAVLDPLTFANLMVHHGSADGSVAGACHSTADVVRNAIQLIQVDPSASLVSSFFIMTRDKPFYDDVQSVIYTDCGLVIEPSAEQLAAIAIAAADSAKGLLAIEPRIAMLSFSTAGSARHPTVDRVSKATDLVRQRRPELVIDGELQFDAAIVPEIAQRKLPNSQLQGRANVFVFPSLDAGNIAYKITERIGGATAIGPLLQGLAKPANDLSRGCSSDDVYNVIAVTAVQAQAVSGH